MNKKNIIIILVIGLVIIGAIAALLLVNENFLTGKQPPENNNANQPNDKANNQQLPNAVDIEGSAAPALNNTEQTIFFSARNFAERFSSFSSDSAGQNINELKSLTVASLFKDLQAQISKKAVNGFYSISSKALKVDILTASQTEANVMVSLQRNEIKDGKEPFVFNQNLELKLIKSGDKWLVSEASWQ